MPLEKNDGPLRKCPHHAILPTRPNSTLRELMGMVQARLSKIDISSEPQIPEGFTDLEEKLTMARYDISVLIKAFWEYADKELHVDENFGFNLNGSNLVNLYSSFVWRFNGLVSTFFKNYVRGEGGDIERSYNNLQTNLPLLKNHYLAIGCADSVNYFNAGINTSMRFLFMPLSVVEDLGVGSREQQLSIIEHHKTRALINVFSVLDIKVLSALVGNLVEDSSGKFLLARYNANAFKISSDSNGEYLDLAENILPMVKAEIENSMPGGLHRVYTACPAVQGQVVDSMYSFFIEFIKRFYCLERS